MLLGARPRQQRSAAPCSCSVRLANCHLPSLPHARTFPFYTPPLPLFPPKGQLPQKPFANRLPRPSIHRTKANSPPIKFSSFFSCIDPILHSFDPTEAPSCHRCSARSLPVRLAAETSTLASFRSLGSACSPTRPSQMGTVHKQPRIFWSEAEFGNKSFKELNKTTAG